MQFSDEQFMGLIQFLSDRENVRMSNSTPDGMTFAQMAEQIVPEFTEEQQVILELGTWEAFLDRMALQMPANLVVAETFLRGIEVGREIERRTR